MTRQGLASVEAVTIAGCSFDVGGWVRPGLLMRPEKDKAEAESRRCWVETDAEGDRGQRFSVRPRPKHYEAEATVSNESCNI